MLRLYLTFIILTFSLIAKSQSVSVEKTSFGLQTGFLGVWVHNESKLTNQIAIRSEVGFDSGIWGRTFYDKSGFLLTPVITVEPRWYYNLNRRKEKSKNTTGNSGNFLALKISYHPDWFVISNYENISVVSDISIIPTWGIRRNISRNFNYEAGIGIGYRYIFAKQAGYLKNESEAALNLHLRVGYRF